MTAARSPAAPGRRRAGLAAAAAMLAALAGPPARADQATDPLREYAPGDAPVPSIWFDVLILPPGADPAEAARAAAEADRRYVAAMRAHHAGALTMARAYLADPNASSPVLRRLAQAIIENQAYEIALLDDIARRIEERPRLADLGFVRLALRPLATENLGQIWGFRRAPLPGIAEALADGPVTERDVQFAKAMTIHHQAALDMARAYNADPNARNGVLKWLNVGIIADQSQEIALMRRVIAAYPGDPEAVRVDPSMIHGMEGHAAAPGHAGGHAAEAPAAAPAPTAAPARRSAATAAARRPAPRPAAAAPAGHAH
ncbi:DUF305 domain-containing protein [Caldovatus aquaticus]|uniref:DUF305 domain-containing protein n=1 Tax=Caldovatus aquaticus TaxID=2865671 RepID=A0ABS7F0E2_9PROT|nr:DUF305 domain-containing protein [Caldovatus aquaticus]MBW8268973.1 DUF305 domain-containing protein [Caldovatus aquaticus]